MKPLKALLTSTTIISALVLSACGGGSPDTPSTCFDFTQETDSSVQWSKLMSADNATKLSEYKLFDDPTNPTINPQSRGLPYDLSVPLFTDYASKYRYIFVPPGCSAEYKEDEVFDFPIGTTLVKSFSMPDSTSDRGIEKEDLIETRLLIKRDTGWIALPYVWNNNKSDAILDVNGHSTSVTVSHNSTSQTFDYKVPDPQSCKNCHQVKQSNEEFADIIPIGPKARFLNKDYTYSDETINQLVKWQEQNILSGLPTELTTVDGTPGITDETNINVMTAEELEVAAKAWLDINCAHCHRREPSGLASNTNMHVEWNRSYTSNAGDHGACEKPISFGGNAGGTANYIIEPGSAEKSLMVYRMDTTDGGDRMPPLGREIIHSEGVALISAWINSMAPNPNCN